MVSQTQPLLHIPESQYLTTGAGCVTCKQKRLKCDEAKPTCQQCTKRNVDCGGYKKDFKWRSFEDSSFNPNKPATKPKKPNKSHEFALHETQPRSIPLNGHHKHPQHGPNPSHSYSPGLDSAFASAAHAIHGEASQSSQEQNAKRRSPHLNSVSYDPPPLEHGAGDFPDGLDPYSLPNTSSTSTNDDGSGRSSGSAFSSGSPHIRDLCLPGTDLNSPPDPSELRPPMSPLPYQPTSLDSPGFDVGMPDEDDFDEEIVRQQPMVPALPELGDTSNWTFRQSSPTPSEASSSSSKSSTLTMFAQPKFDIASPEMLAARFDQETCGILSIKDGPNENPWRTLVWPLARESKPLYHAINTMTAFHGASQNQDLRVAGVKYMTESIKKLSREISTMQLDSALATSLALAFSEGWDQHTSTGIQHLRGARIMVNNAVAKHCRDFQVGNLAQQDEARLRFLCNTYVYMDVIARLTSLEEAHDFDLGAIVDMVNPHVPDLIEVDPLMGCAVSLFPIIGRVANLIQRVRKTPSNSLNLVSEGDGVERAAAAMAGATPHDV